MTHSIYKTSKGATRVKYECPQCAEKLESELFEAGKIDRCPACGTQFTVPGISERAKQAEADLVKAKQLRDSLVKALEESRVASQGVQAQLDANRQAIDMLKKSLESKNAAIEQLQRDLAAFEHKAAQCTPLQHTPTQQVVVQPSIKRSASLTVAVVYCLLFLFMLINLLDYLFSRPENVMQQNALAAMAAARTVIAYVLVRAFEKGVRYG